MALEARAIGGSVRPLHSTRWQHSIDLEWTVFSARGVGWFSMALVKMPDSQDLARPQDLLSMVL